jgi:hypothetical protein
MHFFFLWIDCAKARAVDSMSTDFSYGFGDTQPKGDKRQILKCELSYFTCNFNSVYAKWSSLWIIDGPAKIFC